MEIRAARREDLEQTLAIYNYEVENGVATFDLHPKTAAEWEVWFDAHNVKNHPLLVAVQGEKVLGYASLSSYRSKEAYDSTVELSIYIAPDSRRQGVANALMEAILQGARRDSRTHVVVSVITGGNVASCSLHEKFGFTFCGALRELGWKFGAYRDVLHYSLMVD